METASLDIDNILVGDAHLLEGVHSLEPKNNIIQTLYVRRRLYKNAGLFGSHVKDW